ncbi:AAA ATPase midasin [Phytophthora boehmeriae]|uniref:Midasin n=1 Tax=Phytophthora boehmeriae TaxID=109152 RepID=A0A8T1XC49_9STRA|nr:AAA ATPase midasin [Phytophthora boehmeriae]
MDVDESIVSVSRLESGLRSFLSSGSARLRLHPAAPVLTRSLSDIDVDAAATARLQALATCLVDEELRLLVVKHLRPFLLDLMMRMMDPALVLYEPDASKTHFSECSDSMKRSEVVAATLAELLMFLPSTNTLVLQYFDSAPCFFSFADVAAGRKQQTIETLERVRRIAYTAYRLMCQRPTELSAQWNWTPFFPLSFHEDTYVRWYAARATASILKMGNAQRNEFLSGLRVSESDAVSGKYPDVRQLELARHKEDVTRQEKLIALSVHQQQDESAGCGTRTVPLHDSLKNIFGVVVPSSNLHHERQTASLENSVCTDPLVPTPSTKRNLQSLAIALGLKRPVLVAGSGGCGKTATIRELARLSGNGDLVELHLDDQIDSKTLLGSYVCTDVPGEFTWQPGALTTAVLAGRWVVIEDIERAPFEVLAALMPLLETREMVLPGRGELLVAHSNFQIFGTTSQGHQMPKGFQESVWTSVNIAPLGDDEIEQIILTRFVKIPPQVVSKIMITYNAVSGNLGEEIGGSVQLWKETRRNYGRDFCLRDLLKWCERIYRFCYYAAGNTQDDLSFSHDYITEDERMRIVVEALDVFCAGIRDVITRSRSACALGAIWEVQAEKIEYYLEQHKPHVAFSTHEVEFGRVHLPTLSQTAQLQQGDKPATSSVVMTGHVLRLLEKLAAIVATREPALLIGETGCGKTTIIQHMAAAMGQRLIVQNLNIQSDSSDLVGGFKPVEIHLLARPLYMDFVDLFTTTFSQKNNATFLNVVRIALEHKDWKKLVKGMRKAIQMAAAKLQINNGRDQVEGVFNSRSKMTVLGTSSSVLESRWDTFAAELGRFERQKEQAESHFAFSFVEGVLVKALREGHWVLLDEINLASSDTLERISTLLEHETSAFSLTERGDVEIIRPHPNFRLFGAMNPSTDVGKKDLPPSLRNRFTEIYVDECVNPSDLQMVVHHQFKEVAGALVPETVEFYLEARKQAELRLSDGARHKPRYSLRTLSQALHITRILIQRGYGTSRAMFEGFCSSFCTQLEMDSRQYLEAMIKNTFAKTIKSKELARTPPCPGGSKKTGEFVEVSSYWIRKGDFQPPRDDALPDPVTSRRKFVLTKSVNENLRHVCRAALIGKYPVLLQGPTSAGKTSLIAYLAARIGQKCVRINNHEHTDIQEYLGSYVSDSNGKLTFKEGVLVEAVRKGWWIILDELNLAPSEVLEALNRLLDDNREIFLPETQETVKPHPKFMLFATQNPPGLYGGRKVLSRAFRNRFLEIQVDEVASSELQTILQERSSLPPSYCGILIDIMRQLQLVRQQSSVFAGKSGFITTRDLLRWAERRPATKQALAEEGYCLLAERLRKDDEKQVVKQVLEQKCNVKIDLDALYYSGKPRDSNLLNENGEVEQETVWGTTEQFERVQAMVEQAIVDASIGTSACDGEPKAAADDESMDENDLDRRRAVGTSMGVAAMLNKFEEARGNIPADESSPLKMLAEQIDVLKRRFQSIFEWADGPLVESMKNGDLILIDEVNLAEDAVLERLNSVLEPSRTLLLAEKGGDQVEEIVAHEKWRVMATMNPGGDFGKRELSPALRNRFTEIWVPAISDLDDIATIIRDRLVGSRAVQPPRALPAAATGDLSALCGPILSFVKTFNEANGGIGGCGGVTLRDILSWINFILSVVKKQSDNAPLKGTIWTAFVQGAALAILDGLGLGSDKALHTALKARDDAYQFLLALIPQDDEFVKEKVLSSLHASSTAVDDSIDRLNSYSSDGVALGNFGINPFLISRGPDPIQRKPSFSLKAPTTMSNLYRVLRAMQVSRPIILEGSPGVGKTSLISALAAASGHRLVRINLSEQTDISDLFGSDLPVATDNTENLHGDKATSSGMFEWSDGVFLRALKAGDWVLLDELNLASQSVLEGLNSCLDHRGSVYIPELDREFECPPSFRVFAAQNPLRQGGGRKGLPKSFLNRFTRVFVETLHEQDLIHIASSMYPTLHCTFVGIGASTITVQTLLERMIGFNRVVHEDTMVNCRYGRLGAPWEFNLRDVFRFCDLLKQQRITASEQQLRALSYYVNFIYVERMRSARDRALISCRFEEFFGVKPMNLGAVSLRMSAEFVEIGNASLRRRQYLSAGHVAPPVFNFLLKPMEALVHCVNMSWPALLIGSPASGKTSSVRLLATLSGNTLHELGMSAGTDATELLGCFEQVDVGRKLRDIKQRLQNMYEKMLQQLMLDSASPGEASQLKKSAKLKQASRLSSAWWALATREKYFNENVSPSVSSRKGEQQKPKKLAKGQLDDVAIDLLKDVVSLLKKASAGDDDGLLVLTSLSNEIDFVVQLSKSSSIASCFEWVDGTLIQAMERGEWVLLDNVNFCSSSVLDRLNALMETGGEMLINECGLINGKLRVIKPHKNFRIFLAMDPQFGEVSRAMRNRCVEIALVDEDAPRLDLIKIPLACGIPGYALSQAFQIAHEGVVNKLNEHAVGMKFSRINRRHLENWALLTSAELSRGVQPLEAIAESFQRVYGDGLLTLLGLSQEILEIFLTAIMNDPSKKVELENIWSSILVGQQQLELLDGVECKGSKQLKEASLNGLCVLQQSYAVHKYHADRANLENELVFLKLQEKQTDMTTLISKKTLYLSEIEDNADSHVDLLSEEDSRIGKDAPILLFDMRESALLVDRIVTFQLSPLLEHALARQELEAIAELVRVGNMYQLYKDCLAPTDQRSIQKAISGVLKQLEDIIEELVRLGLRNPACFYAYQDIVWCGHKFSSIEVSSEEHVLDDGVELEKFFHVVQSHLNGVLFGFHQFLRCNSFNQMDMISLEIFDTRRKLRKANRRRPVSSRDVEEHQQIITGFPRLFQAVQSAVVLKSISEVDLEESSCATSEAQMRTARLEKIKSHYAAEQAQAAKKMPNVSISFVKELFVATVLAFRTTFQTNCATEQWKEIQAMLIQFSNSSRSFDTKTQTQLLKALRTSGDSAFVALVDMLVAPLMKSLEMETTKPNNHSRGGRSTLGESMMLLGLWRFALLLPSSPVDPVTKPLVKKELLLDRLAMLTMQDAADSAIHRLNPLPASSPEAVDNAAQSLQELHTRIMEVSAHAIQRYQPAKQSDTGLFSLNDKKMGTVATSVFGELFRDLLRFNTTVMPAGKMLALLATVGSSKSSPQRKRELLRELDMFQQTSESFLAQLSKKFGECFRDIVEPVAAAIYCVKEGAALLSWSLYQQLKEKTFKDQQKETLALALVQFPSALRSISHESTTDLSWRSIQLMLQTVGTPATSLLFGGGLSNKRKVEVALLDVALAKMEFMFRDTVLHSRSNRALDAPAVNTALGSSKALFELFLTKWQEQKEREEQKRKEEEELFKYKVRQLDIETEEELLEKEYREQFPDYTGRDFQAFLGSEQSSGSGIEETGLSAAADMDLLITDKIMQRLCETHTKLYAEMSNSKIVITKGEIVNTFARAFSLAVKMRKSLNATASSDVERAVASSGVYAASLVQARLGNSVGAKNTVPSFQTLSSDYIRGVDFHRDPLVKEVVLVAEPLQQLMVKVQSLLAMWPDHAILQQIVLIADRIRNFEISSPLVRTLTGVELLLRKAQEWEAYAAKAYSISDELGVLSSLVTRWRKLELYSWPHLLLVKEKQHRLAAQKTWISMYSLLTAQFETDDNMVAGWDGSNVIPSNIRWLHLNHLSQWLFTPLTGSNTAVQQSANEQRDFMNKLFETLDAYVRSCTIGQYETRLLVVYSFCAQLFMEIWNSSGLTYESATKSSKYALANMLYHLYRYYGQHLGYLERQWSGLKAPIQRKLIEFVKICRWDEQTYYSLAESAEKSHRKLMKFVRDYDAVLTVPMQTVIDASTDNGITKEGGFVGIHSTKAELAVLDDGVLIPKDVEYQPTDSKNAQEGTGERQDTEDENYKKSKEDAAEQESQVAVRPPGLRLIHIAANSVLEMSQDTMLKTSAYAEKLPGLSKRIAKYTQKHILSLEQVERRQQVRDLCEDLCETIFYRMFKLQHATGLPKGAKKKALIDLLGELKAQGMVYHRLQLPSQQQNIQQLFELDVPDVENCLHVDNVDSAVDSESVTASANINGLKQKKTRGEKKMKQSGKDQHANVPEESLVKNSPMWLWQRADGYYYRFLGQLASLRYSAVTSFSHDLSTSETDRMSGYAENMLFSMLQQRQILHATSLNHEKLVDGLATLKLMKEFKDNYLSESNDGAVVIDAKVATEWQTFQQTSLVSLRRSLRELEISVTQILQLSPEASSSVLGVRQSFQRIFEHCDAIDKTFIGHTLTQSLGVPAIPHRAVSTSEDAGSDAAMMAFARPSKRVYGISPVISRTGYVRKETIALPVATDLLKTNSTSFGKIQDLLMSISTASGSVTTQCGLSDFIADYTVLIQKDGEFLKCIDKKVDSLSHEGQKVNKHESVQAMSLFSEHYDLLIETVLVSIQDLSKMSINPAVAEGEDEDSGARSLRNELATISSMMKVSRLNQIASQFVTLITFLETQYAQLARTHSAEWRRVFEASLSLVERLEPVLIDVRGISRQLLVDFLVAHKSIMKLDFVLIRIFRNLFQHGFCRTDEQQQDEEGEGTGKMQFQDDVDGTGMGEGEGKKDVSHEIEDEEQLLGLQGDQQEEQEPPNDDKPDDTGLEMQNDFEGTMQDVPDDEKQNDDDPNDDDEEELDREMGEFDQDDENVVDEKMWGEDSDDDEDNIDKDKEKFEEDSKVEGEALEDEVRGKDGDEEDKADSKKDEDKPQSQPQPELSDDKGTDEDNGDGDDDGDENMDEEVNDDFEDKYEDHHDVDPQDREEGHGDDETEEEHGDDLPENMQLDNDADDGDEDADAEGDNPNDESMDAPDDLEDDALDDDATGEEAAAGDNDEEEAEEENEEPLDNAVQLGGGGLEDDPEQADENDEEEAEQTEVPETSQEEQAASAVAGTQSKDGHDELEAEEQSAEDQEMEDANTQDQDQEQNTDESNSSRAQQQSSSNDQDERKEWKPQSQVASNPEQERPREKRRDRREPNPYRSAQEAQEHWKKRVEMVEPSEDEQESDNNRGAKEEKAAEMTTAEFVDDDEEMEDVEHALAPADENQIMNQPRTDDEEDVEKKEEDKNSGAGATAMEVDDVEKPMEDAKDKEEETNEKPMKQEPKRESEVSDDNPITQADKQKPDEQSEKPEAAKNGDHQLLDDDADQALPSKLRDLDLSSHILDQEDGDEEAAQEVKLLSPDEVAVLRDELDTFIAHWSSQAEQERGADLWAKYTALTAGPSQRLCEQLRLVLEPMLRAKLEGDFRTGKRINMRKVIPYIASQFRKDKIWLRRTRPSKRQYQVMLAIDDSESMADNHAGRLALEALATLCKGMTQLEVGELSVVKFGQDLELLHAFDTPFTDDAGSRMIGRFGFQQKKTNMVQTLDTILQLLETAKQSSAAASSTVEFTQIVFLISDGRFDSDGRVRIRKLIETALERQQLIVLLIVDQGAADGESSAAHQQTSILDTQSVTFEKGKVRMVPYLESYPFPYYVLLPTSAMLPEILSDSLRQWFEMLQAKN